MRKLRFKAIALAPVVVLATASCSQEEIGDVRYTTEQCRRVALVDDRGAIVIGAEDLALDKQNDRIFISAYDRRASEKAAKKRRGDAPPSGGVYAISLSELFNADNDEIAVSSLASAGHFAGGLRPHGLHFDAKNAELIFINRTYASERKKWRMTPRLQRIGANGEVFVGEAQEARCASNDVTIQSGEILTTFDHGSCGFGAGLEDVFRLKRSGFIRGDGEISFEKAAFANGIAVLENDVVVIAATREDALLLLNDDEIVKRIEVPGGPDNLTVSSDNMLIAGVHPKMMKLALNRKLGWGAAPSRIIKADPESGAVEVLFDDPKGALFSAATAAVETDKGLVAGSVTDEGLLVCSNQ